MKINIDIDKVTKEVQQKIDKEMQLLAERTVNTAKENHPYKNITGTNSASITWDGENMKYRVYTQSSYGGFLELGTSQNKPYPYIWPAFQKEQNVFLNRIKGLF